MNHSRAGGPGYDQIEVTAPDGTQTIYSVPSEEFVIGRLPECGLRLSEADLKVSKRHALVKFSDGTYMVNDLESRNGTFWDEQKLLPGKPIPWGTEKSLRIGRHTLRLRLNPRPERPVERAPTSTSHYSAPQSDVSTPKSVSVASPTPGPAVDLRLELEQTAFEISPGEQVTLKVLLTNLGERTAHYVLDVRNLPGDWVTISPRQIELMPSSVQKNAGPSVARVTITTPQSAKTRAGRFGFEVCATKVDDPSQVIALPAKLTIKPFGPVEAELRQTRAPIGTTLRVAIHNRSNATQTVSLRCWDEANELRFTVKQDSITLAAGDRATFDFRADLKRRHWIGGARTHRFKLKVTGVAQGAELGGEFTSRALIPKWLPPALLLGTVAIGTFAWNTHQQQVAAEATMTAVAAAATQAAMTTMTAAAVELTATAAAQETLLAAAVRATEVAETTAVAAATATELWLVSDADRDLISSRDELAIGIDPNRDDTDNDGLHDGVELNRYGTNPLEDDSDVDGLKDGAEVAAGLDPLDQDTDNDGIIDSADVAPLATSTPTPDTPGTRQAAAAGTATAKAEANQTETARAAATATADFKATAAQMNFLQQVEETRQAEAARAAATQAAIFAQGTADARAAAQAAEQTRAADRATLEAVWTEQARALQPTSTPTPALVGMSIDQYCQSLGQRARRIGDDLYSWGCSDDSGNFDPLDNQDYAQICFDQAGFDYVPDYVNATAFGWVCRKR